MKDYRNTDEKETTPSVENKDNEDKINQPRNLTFYDFPRYFKEEDIMGILEQLGKVSKISVKQAYKYLTVKTTISLNDFWEDTYNSGAVNVTLNYKEHLYLLRWFDQRKIDRSNKKYLPVASYYGAERRAEQTYQHLSQRKDRIYN